MEIWRGRPEHAETLGRLLRDFNDEFETPGPSADVFAERFRRQLARDDVLAYLAGGVDEPCGFALLTLRPTPYSDGPLAQLEELYVRPELRDRGIGGAIMAEAMREALARGCGEMMINVDEVDTDTRRFYERLGFSNLEPGTADSRMLCYLLELAG